MDLWEATKILFRRWYVTIPICVLAALGALAAGSQMDPEYVASSVGILLPIDEAGEQNIFGTLEDAENPWESAGAVATMRAVALVLGADTVRSQVVELGFSPTYSIEVEPRDPIVYIDVTDRDPDLALVTLDEMILRLEDELDARQAQVGADETRRYKVEILSQSEVPLPDYSNRTRVRIIVLLLGIVLAAAAGLLYDAWAVARAERRDADEDADDTGAAEIEGTASDEPETTDGEPIGRHVASTVAVEMVDGPAENDADLDEVATDEVATERAPATVGARRGELHATGSSREVGSDKAASERRASGTSKRR